MRLFGRNRDFSEAGSREDPTPPGEALVASRAGAGSKTSRHQAAVGLQFG